MEEAVACTVEQVVVVPPSAAAAPASTAVARRSPNLSMCTCQAAMPQTKGYAVPVLGVLYDYALFEICENIITERRQRRIGIFV